MQRTKSPVRKPQNPRGATSLIRSATILLHVSYPDAYPEVAPELDVSSPPNASKYPLLDVAEDKSRLLDALQESIEESMGMAMIFTLVSTLKDAAELIISERQAAVQALEDVEKAKVEEEENRKFHGTAVTRESFLEWRERFRKEMAEEELRRKEEKEAEDKKKKAKEEKKLSGRQLWERGMVGKVEEEEVDGEDALQALSSLKVEA